MIRSDNTQYRDLIVSGVYAIIAAKTRENDNAVFHYQEVIRVV